MKLADVPPPTLARLMELSERAEALSRAADAAEAALQRSRDILSGRQPPPGFGPGGISAKALSAAIAPIRAGFDAQDKATQQARRDADAAQRVASACKAFVAMLPADAKLEPIAVDIEGQNLPAVRGRLKQIQAELGVLQAAPVPSPDLLEQVAAYVDALAASARPYVDGIGAGQQLRVLWPSDTHANRGNLAGFGDAGSVLMFMAALFPHQLARLVMNSAEVDCAKPLPVAERPARIAQLRAELDVWHRVAAALVNNNIAAGGDETHDPATPPQCVLGVCVGAFEVAPSQLQLQLSA